MHPALRLRLTLAALALVPCAQRGLAQTHVPFQAWHFVDGATIPEYSPGMPEYAKLLYRPRVDMQQLAEAMQRYSQENEGQSALGELEEDPYAKYVHTWIQSAQNFIDDNGIVAALDTAGLQSFRAQQALHDTTTNAPSAGSAAWSFVGPRRTLWRADHVADQPVAPWQVNIYCVAAAPSDPDVLICGSETGAVYRTDDRGLNWFPIDTFNWGRAILSVAIHPTDPNRLFVGTSTDVVRSTDGGATWSIVLTQAGLSCNSLAISPSNPNHVFAGGAAGLFSSSDSGTSWNLAVPAHIDDVEIRPGDGSTVYAIARNGTPDTYSFYRSTDAGQSFSLSMSGWPNLLESSGARLAVSPADPDVVYALLLTEDAPGGNKLPVLLRSSDAGSTWTTAATCTTTACPMNNGQGYYDMDIVVSATDPDLLMIATSTCYRSDDGGASWSIVGGYGGPFAIHPDIQGMITSPDGNGESTWIATDGGLSHSTDFFGDTANWEARIDGLDGTDLWGYAQGWNEDFQVGGRYHNGNTAMHEDYPEQFALRLGGAESPTGWALHGRERHAAFDDIEELILPPTIDAAPEGSFAFTKHPNIHYYGDAFSRVMVDPEDFQRVYVGSGNHFWQSNDGGSSWVVNETFVGTPFHYDISRDDPNVFYLTATSGFYRSINRGQSFTARTLPAGLTSYHSQNLRVAASSENADQVWVLNQRSSASSSVGRVFGSLDGGGTWTDLTTPALLGRKWTSLVHQAGTDGGVYIASRRGESGGMPAKVMYRDNGMTDWADYSSGLPASANPIKLVPFYRDGKLRWAGNRGVWEIDLYEQDWAPTARPFVSGQTQVCLRDTVEFDSYSVARGDATYQWSIPGASWTSPLDQREVHAQFPSIGFYAAELTVTQGGVSDTESVSLLVANDCEAEATPGRALKIFGASGDYAVSKEPLGLETNELTMTAWIKRDGDQEPFSGIVFARSTSSGGINMQYSNRLGFHWNNTQWGWNSGLVVPDGEWTHVAMVVTPTETTLYMNGRAAVNGADQAPYLFDSPLYVGADKPWSGRRFRGEIDEVRVFDRALSTDEIRATMHLTSEPDQAPSLIAYWQFNRTNGVETDRVGTNHMSLAGSASRVPSSAPVGPGASESQYIISSGTYNFAGADLTLDFPSTGVLPEGQLSVTRIDHTPYLPPAGNLSPSYWVVHNYGSNQEFEVLDAIRFQDLAITPMQAAIPHWVRLHTRAHSAAGAVWGKPLDIGDEASAGSSGSVTFGPGNGQRQFGQYVVTFASPQGQEPE